MSYSIPDPERASHNVETFLAENPGFAGRLQEKRNEVSLLFSCSQFLATHATRRPEVLFHALDNLGMSFAVEELGRELRALLSSCASLAEGMAVVRRFRKDKFIVITLKDLLRKADLQEIMLDISTLADAIVDESLRFVETTLRQRYGDPADNAVAVIGLGKLGAQELNYSSDIDIIFVYRAEGETGGVAGMQGVTMNRITAFEYYTKLVEEMTRFLSANTEDGFAYRVDLRLRPQGQRGSLALSLRGYEEYYESWGQLWERAALLRARAVAGDAALGREFLALIEPFVFRKYLDFQAIDEIRRMKSQVEQIKPGAVSRDIKRGYGGIREIEFFMQVFQLIYGGREPLLRERSTVKTLHSLTQKGMIGYEDFQYLSENYLYLRTLEHRLQQLNDLQTQSLPAGERELDILGRKMGFSEGKAFLAALDQRRRKVRAIYDSLLEVRPDDKKQRDREGSGDNLFSRAFWDDELPLETLLDDALTAAGVRNKQRSVHYLNKIRNTIHSFQTIRGRRLLEEIVPQFVEAALKGPDPDLALLQLVDFAALIATNESYLEAVSGRREIVETLTFIFSHSEYLSRIFMSNPRYIGSLFEGEVRGKGLRQREAELLSLAERYGEATAIRLFRRLEEIRLGILFLNRDISVRTLMHGLSNNAELIMKLLLAQRGPSPGEGAAGGRSGTAAPLGVIGFGKLGGREMTFSSDLDLIFISPGDPPEAVVRAAERLVRVVTSYTKDGSAYAVDTRLRPDGSKGPLVRSLGAMADYYRRDAQPWELQALLKGRPVSGDIYIARGVMALRHSVLLERGRDVSFADIRRMRERILKELSKESPGSYDIKLGAGGLEELEFIVQYLQLSHCRAMPFLLVQGTLPAIARLSRAGVVAPETAGKLREIYLFYRGLETVLRLRNETVLREGSGTVKTLCATLGLNEESILQALKESKEWVSGRWRELGRS